MPRTKDNEIIKHDLPSRKPKAGKKIKATTAVSTPDTASGTPEGQLAIARSNTQSNSITANGMQELHPIIEARARLALFDIAEQEEEDEEEEEAEIQEQEDFEENGNDLDEESNTVIDVDKRKKRLADVYIEQFSLAPKTVARVEQSIKQIRVFAKTQPFPICNGLDVLNASSEELCFNFLEDIINRVSYGQVKNHVGALRHYFRLEHSCGVKSMDWKKEHGTDKWSGNPVYSERFRYLLKTKKLADSRGHTIKHAKPMLYKHLKPILESLQDKLAHYNKTPEVVTYERTQDEYMHFFMTLAYLLWTRNNEMCNMTWSQISDVQTNNSNHKYIEVNLTFRKNNQFDDTAGRIYQLFHLPQRDQLKIIWARQRWYDYTIFLGRIPRGTDLVFPLIKRTTGTLHFGKAVDAAQISNHINSLEKVKEICAAENCRFSSHCFRRGGAQDCTAEAAERGEKPLSLRAALWWGGWEDLKTMMTYILKKAQQKEEYFGNVFDPSRQPDPNLPYTVEQERLNKEMQERMSNLEKQMVSEFGQVKALIQLLAQQRQSQNMQSTVATLQLEQAQDTACNLAGTSVAADAGAFAAAAISSSTAHNERGKRLPMSIPSVDTVEEVVKQWQYGDEAKGLRALHKWAPSDRVKGVGGNAQTYSSRKTVWEAYEACNNDWDKFYNTYGGKGKKLHQYIAAIEAADPVKQARKQKRAEKRTRTDL